MKSKSFQIINFILVAGMILSACASQAQAVSPAQPPSNVNSVPVSNNNNSTSPSVSQATMAPTTMAMPAMTPESSMMSTMSGPTTKTGATDLRQTLDRLFSEHVLLAASATGAALGGRQDEFKAAADALDGNSKDIAAAIGSVYGQSAADAFLPLWRNHINLVVNYTTGLATKDKAKSDKAVQDLIAYTKVFADFLTKADPNLDNAATAKMVEYHILTLKAVIDAQANGDPTQVYTALRTARAHMSMFAESLATAIAQQFPDKFSGQADSPAATLRASLDALLSEHVYLAADATGAALGGRQAEFQAAAATLDDNSKDIAAAVGSIYGQKAQDTLLPLWRSHINLVVDYTTGLATKDKAKSDKAVQDLLGYIPQLAAFFSSANPSLDKATLTDLIKTHILTLKSVIDAQAAGNPVDAYTALRAAFAHMPMVGDPLSEAIVQQFPDKFK